jgi:hypothetical protein
MYAPDFCLTWLAKGARLPNNGKLEIGNSKLESRNWKLAVESWKAKDGHMGRRREADSGRVSAENFRTKLRDLFLGMKPRSY